MALFDVNSVNLFTSARRGLFMCLFLQRDEYSTNPNQWPVVPFSLIKQADDVAKLFQTEYKVGFEKAHILGWSLGVAEEIDRPALVFTRSLVNETDLEKTTTPSDMWTLCRTETEKYYGELAPICGMFKNSDTKFKNKCTFQDDEVIKAIFQFIDSNKKDDWVRNQISIQANPDTKCDTCDKCERVRLIINAIPYENHVYFKYECPCTRMMEFVFPILCEEVPVALVMVGQVIEDIEKVKERITVLDPTGETLKKIEDKGAMGKFDTDAMLAKVCKSIDDIVKMYQNQVDGERRRIMNQVLNELTEQQRAFSLYDDVDILYDGLYDMTALNKKATAFFDKTLKTIKERFGAGHVFLYLDDELNPESNVTGTFCKDWKKSTLKKNWFQTVWAVGDLFVGFHGTAPNAVSHLTREQIMPTDPDWSVFLFEGVEGVDPTDNSGTAGALPPLVIGINYKGGEAGKLRYMHANDESLYWENYVLPKFALFARSVILSLMAHKNADALMEGRITMDHEMGQITSGIQGITETFERRCERLQDQIRNMNTDIKFLNDIDKYFVDFVKNSKRFSGDISGQFRRIQLQSKIYGENPVPTPKNFDYVTAFLGKWEYIFTSQCRDGNKWPIFHYPDIREQQERWMYSDPVFLEHAVFNMVNNAIKYSHVNTKIHVTFAKTGDFHTITVRDYGNFLSTENRDIFKRGYRGEHGEGVRNMDDVKAWSDSNDQSDFTQSDLPGKGFGLYLSQKLIKALQGSINDPVCVKKSLYNLPLMRPFFKRYSTKDMFKKMWDRWAKNEEDLPYDDIKHEYDELTKNDAYGENEYSQIVNLQNIQDLEKLPFNHLFKHMRDATYEVTFTITIPRYIKEDVQ